MKRWTRRFTFVALMTLALSAAGSLTASAACSPVDITCRADETIDTREGLVDDVIDPIDTPVDDTIDPVVDPVVDDVLGGGGIDLPDPVGGGGGGSHGGGSPIGGEPTGPPNPTGSLGVADGRNPDGPGLTGLPGPIISAASGTAPPVRADRTSGDRFGEALGGVARSLAIVLALFGLAVAFVAIQDRLDRSDPRLALAPVESDVVEFA